MKRFVSAEAVKYGFRQTKSYFWFLAGLLSIMLMTFFAFDFLSRAGNISFWTEAGIEFIAMLVNIIMSMGIIHISLKIYDGRRTSYSDLADTIPFIFRYVLASIIYGLMVLGGFILFVIPGIYLAITYSFYPFALIDGKLPVMAAFKKSAQITKGFRLELFALAMILGLINLLGLLVLGLGLFVSIPVGWMAAVYAYRRLEKK